MTVLNKSKLNTKVLIFYTLKFPFEVAIVIAS